MESQSYEQQTKFNPSSSSLNDDIPGVMTASKITSNDEPAWKEWLDFIVDFLGKMPEELGSLFSDYKKPLTTFSLILTAGITVYVTLSVLDAIDNIPLLSPILELVGLGYTAWFVTRYLLKASTREELFAEFNGLKQQVLGNKAED